MHCVCLIGKDFSISKARGVGGRVVSFTDREESKSLGENIEHRTRSMDSNLLCTNVTHRFSYASIWTGEAEV